MDVTAYATLHSEVEQLLRAARQRYTGGRRRLVETLALAARPVQLPDIESLAPDVPRSSAYRNLEVLERCGVVHRLVIGGDHAYYELAESLLGHHHHAICVRCGAVSDIRLNSGFEAKLEESLAAAADESGFNPLHHIVEIHGTCSDCSRQDAEA